MTTWIAQHFLNPAYFWPALALVALPILIHLINRLRYRRVRFAAMEFLLESQQQNRRRVLLEHLLLLLLRILIVLLIGLLIARLILDPSQLSFLRGAKSHHVVLLDDSGSMQDRVGEGTAFDEAKSVIQRLVTEGARRPGTQTLTVLRMSDPETTFANLGERDIDEALVQEVASKLEALTPTQRQVDLLAGLEAARQRLADDRAAARFLHVVSDVRHRDWIGQAAIGPQLAALNQADVAINLVRTVDTPHENLGITRLTGALQAAAAGVPLELVVGVANFGTREATDVRVLVAADGQRLPLNLILDVIPPGEEVERRFEVEFENAGRHRLEVSLESDSLEIDNVRHLAIDVPQENAVLIVDGAPGSDQALYLVDALAADRSVTGYAPLIVNVEGLRRTDLGPFQSLYLLNVAELPPDALVAIEQFVDAGGGLVWFLGDQVRPAFYNDRLYRDGAGLFPARLSLAPQDLVHRPTADTGPDLIVEDHPIFSILGGQENPFIESVLINRLIPVDPDWRSRGGLDEASLRVIARLRSRDPLILEHRFGAGTVITCLTSAGPLATSQGQTWNNWASGPGAPSFAVLMLELQKYIAREDRIPQSRIVGEPIIEQIDRQVFREELELELPDERVISIKAAPPEDMTAGDADASLWELAFRDTDLSGMYRIRRFDQSGQPTERWIAYNPPTEESELAVAEDSQLWRMAGDDTRLTIQPAGVLDWIRSESPGQDVRWLLLAALLLLLAGEQALACRLGYHRTRGQA